jgi:hypothetical protein
MSQERTSAERTTVRRLPDRGRYDEQSIFAIVDATSLCHLAITDPEGRPVVLPTLHARVGNRLYVHGSPASRLLRSARGSEVCCTISVIDGLVLARSAFHHSVNYRSVVVFGRAVEVLDDGEKRTALEAIVEHMIPGRSQDCRPPSPKELRGTTVLALELTEASAKIRTGGPVDDDEDLALPHWAGVVPVRQVWGTPIPDPIMTARRGDVSVPEYLAPASGDDESRKI